MDTGKQTGIVVSALGIIFSYYSLKLNRATIGNPIEPMIFPLILGTILTLCGVTLFLRENCKKTTQKSQKKNKSTGISHEFRMVTVICVSSILYGMVLEKIGYVFATTLFLGTLLFAFNGKKQWLINLIVAIAFSVSIYYCFSQVLGIPLPQIPFFKI